MLNKVILMGRLVRDPELRNTPSGVSVVNFTLAVERSYAKPGEDKETDFINIIAWRNTADFVAKYFTKGQLVAISGRLQVRSWDDVQTGQKRYATDVVADEVFFAEGKRDGQVAQTASVQTAQNTPAQPEQGSLAGFTSADEDLPF